MRRPVDLATRRGALGSPRDLRALDRASVNSDAANQRSPNDVDPFYREVPEPQERHTQEGERQIERDNSAQGPVHRGHRQETARSVESKAEQVAAAKTPVKIDEPQVEQ